MKSVFSESKGSYGPLIQAKDIFLQNDGLKNGKYKNFVAKEVRHNKIVFSFFCPGTTWNMTFQLPDWIVNYFAVRGGQLHF